MHAKSEPVSSVQDGHREHMIQQTGTASTSLDEIVGLGLGTLLAPLREACLSPCFESREAAMGLDGRGPCISQEGVPRLGWP